MAEMRYKLTLRLSNTRKVVNELYRLFSVHNVIIMLRIEQDYVVVCCVNDARGLRDTRMEEGSVGTRDQESISDNDHL